MLVLTDELIETTIDSVAGFIIATVSADTDRSLEEIAELFYSSQMYELLSDKKTGYYWDSIPDMVDRFRAEITNPYTAHPR